MTTVPQHHVFELPWPCPICHSKVSAMANAWNEDGHGFWMASEIETQCESEPEQLSDDEDCFEWEEWFNSHYSTPYIDWLRFCFAASICAAVTSSLKFTISKLTGVSDAM